MNTETCENCQQLPMSDVIRLCQLHASAPELLEALESIASLLGVWSHHLPDAARLAALREQGKLLNIVAKAKGKKEKDAQWYRNHPRQFICLETDKGWTVWPNTEQGREDSLFNRNPLCVIP